MRKIDVLIIGAGPSGIYAATYAALKNLNVVVVEASDAIGGQPKQIYAHKKIYDFPGHEVITGNEIVANLLNQQKRDTLQVNYILNTKLNSWKRNKNGTLSVQLTNKEIVNTKAIVIATGNGGFGPTKLDPSLIATDANHDRISYYVQDFLYYENKRVVFLGGGDSAVEWAEQLGQTKCTQTISIIHRNPTYRANAVYVNQMRQQQVREYLDAKVVKIEKQQILITNNQTNKEQFVPYDEIIIQYGFNALTNRAQEWKELNKQGAAIIVNAVQQTSEPNIYAIGLAANYQGRANLMVTGMAEAVNAIKDINAKINPYGTSDYIVN